MLDAYPSIFNNQSTNNNIRFEDGIVTVINDGQIVRSQSINSKMFQWEKIEYLYNIFLKFMNVHFSTFEADRKDAELYWIKRHKGIDFPKMMPIFIMSFLLLDGNIDLLDIGATYHYCYFNYVKKEDIKSFAHNYKDGKDHMEHLYEIMTYTDGRQTKNRVLEFKPEYKYLVKNLPNDQFTTADFFARVYKLFGPCYRNMYDPVRMNELVGHKHKIIYDLYYDMSGIDYIIDDVLVMAFTDTEAAKDFSDEKIFSRHPELAGKRIIKTIKKIDPTKKGLQVTTDEKFLEIAHAIDTNTIPKDGIFYV